MTMLDRLRYKTPGIHLNPLIYPFLVYSFATGLAFVFFEDSAPVQASVLFQLTLAHAPDLAISVWGVLAMVVPVLVVVGLVVRQKWLGDFTTWLGFAMWVYAAIIFALYGFWLQVFTAGFINVFFWAWYWFQVRYYYNSGEEAP